MDDYEKELNANADWLGFNERDIEVTLKAIAKLSTNIVNSLNKDNSLKPKLSGVVLFAVKANKHAKLCKKKQDEILKENELLVERANQRIKEFKDLQKSFENAYKNIEKGLGQIDYLFIPDMVPHIPRWQEYSKKLKQDLEGINVSFECEKKFKKEWLTGIRDAKSWFVAAVNNELIQFDIAISKGQDDSYGTLTTIVSFMNDIYGESTQREQNSYKASHIMKNGTRRKLNVNTKGLSSFHPLLTGGEKIKK